MSDDPPPFPRVTGRGKGYDPEAVDAFLQRARDAYGAGSGEVDAASVRRVGFPLVRGGYRTEEVDGQLARIEDAFAAREQNGVRSRAGARARGRWARTTAEEILRRLSRPPGTRFRRTSWMRYGYRIEEVDLVADRARGFLRSGSGLTVEQIRTVAFHLQRGGYDEAQVDAVLDTLIEVMLAVR